VPIIIRETPFFIEETHYISNHILENWNLTILKFIEEEIESKKFVLTIERNLREFLLFSNKELRLLCKEDIYQYEKYLFFKMNNNDISLAVFNFRMRNLITFFVYLYRKEVIDYLITKDIKNGFSVRLKIATPKYFKKKIKSEPSEVIKEFITYLSSRNYAIHSTNYKGNIIHFSNYIKNTFNIEIEDFLKKSEGETILFYISKYEQMLAKRVSLEEIENYSAYHYLRTIKLFVNFLNDEKLIKISYIINDKFSSKGKRGNDYVPSTDVIKMLDMIYLHSQNIYRDLSIFLLLLDTGCRSIEICNLKIPDINFIERTIKINSKKSGTRTLQVSKEVFDVLKDYLSVRNLYQTDSISVFLKNHGTPIENNTVLGIFSMVNQKAFDKKKYTPKGFRHTYITNALENSNSIDKVSKIAGHKHWISTFYYLHRSKSLLLKNTLDFSPLKEMGGI
jgi:integrase